MGSEMLHETIWFDKHKYDEAEEHYQAYLNGVPLQESASRGQTNQNANQKNVDKKQKKNVDKKPEQTKDRQDQTKVFMLLFGHLY